MIIYEIQNGENRKDYVYRVIKDNIMTLELKPGELISEADLSSKLNLSRTPIREVLMKLKQEHLIEVKPQAGTYISLIDEDLINEAVFMRYVIEKEVIKLACEYFSEEMLIELEKNLFAQKMIKDISGKDVEFHKLDTAFHEILYSGTKNLNIWESIKKISTHYNRMRLLFDMKRDREEVIKQHEEIVEIIKSKSINKVDDIVTKHIKDPVKYWDKLIDSDEEIRYYLKNRRYKSD